MTTDGRRRLLLAAIVGALIVLAAVFSAAVDRCGGADASSASGPDRGSSDIDEAKERLSAALLVVPGVAGVGIGECKGDPCIVVLLEEDTPELRARVPAEFEGFTVRIEVSGPIVPLPQ